MRWIAVVAVCVVVCATARADDWGARRDPFDPALVRSYKAALARDPHDEAMLRQLVALYQRYRTIGKLEAEYRVQLEAGDDWATLVVLAQLPRPSRAESLELWKRAVAAKPDDALGWLAEGDAETADAAAAREAYRHAAKLTVAPRQKKLALTKLIGAAQLSGDFATVDGAYEELIALAPKDGGLWLDRGNAQLAAKQFEPARASFSRAEELLRADPERQLTAMMSQGIAVDALGRTDEAVAEYEHALDHVPSGYFLGAELVSRIVDDERKRGRLAAVVVRFEQRWPERRRGYFEWATLGDLYRETHDDPRAIDAYKHAVAKAPTEVGTQRKLIKLLDDVSPDAARAQHEVAARYAPGDADLQIELAKRYHPEHDDKAFATLDALARRSSKNVNVRSTIATLYEQWDQLDRAIREYEAVAALEPKEPDHAIVLGEAYWRANDQPKARAAWDRLAKIGTPDALYRLGEVLAVHDAWADAVAAYTKSLALDGANAEALYGRARAHDQLGHWEEALDDARRAVALTGQASHADGLRNRQLLVHVLGRARTAGDRVSLDAAVARWRFAFERGDIAAGYLLAAHHARIGSYQQHAVLVKLYGLVPLDDSLGIVVARSFAHRKDFARAKHELERIAQRTPARAEEVGKLIAQLDVDRERAEREIRWKEEGRSAPFGGAGTNPDLVGRHGRLGVRVELGTDTEASGAVGGFGVYRTYHAGRGTAVVWRVDWTKRDQPMKEVDALALAVGVTTRLLDARKFELAAGAAPRFEVRFSDAPSSTWDRAGLAGDLTLELLPRALPATLGLRFDQTFTDVVRSSTLLVELGFEVR